MPVMIRQGKQDTSNDNFNFEPFEEKDVLVLIEKLDLNKYLPGNLNVHLRLLTGAHQKRGHVELVAYDPTNANSWKYRSLRKCAGVPYQENEPEQIDIEGLLKDKIVMADFTIFTKKDGTKGQNVTFKVPTKEALDEAFPSGDVEELEDLPFGGEVSSSPVPDSVVENPTPVNDVELAQDNDDADWEE